MKLIYLYTSINWYRVELFKSISKLIDTHVYILNEADIGYKGIEYLPDYGDINISFLTKKESEFHSLCEILNKEEFDSIVVPSMNDLFYIQLTTRLVRYYSKKGKRILYFWEYWPMEGRYSNLFKKAKQELRHFFTRINKPYIDAFLTPGINTLAFYYHMGVPSKKIYRCYNASEVSKNNLDVGIVRKKYGITANEKVILYFGRIEEYKGFYELIDAFNKCYEKSWHLLICGPGEEKLLNKNIKNFNIHITGSIKPENRCNYYSAANVFILPNNYKEKIEPWGLTVNEAMSFGLPILASDATGSAVDLVFPGVNGFRLDSNNLTNDIMFYIKKIFSDEELEKQLGINSKIIVQNYTFDNMAKAFVAATARR